MSDIQLDFEKVSASYQRQVSEQSRQIAIKDAIIETCQEEIAQLRQMIDTLSNPTNVGKEIPDATPKKKRTK